MSAFKLNKITAYVSLLLSFSLIFWMTGCTDNKQLKQDLLQAVGKQEGVKSYRFSGSLELKADSSLFAQANPVAVSLFALIRDSKIDYTGVSSLEPSRMETDLKVTPAGATAIDIPVLIKDSKLYFHMPALNQDDEYMAVPIQTAQPASPAGGQAEPLKNTGRLMAALNQQLFNEIDPKWLQTSDEPVKLADGTMAKRITLNVNDKNEQAFAAYWDKSLPGFMELFKTNGLASGATLDSWQAALKQLKWKAPSTIDMLIDDQGYVHEQKWSLSFTTGNSSNVSHLVWTHSLAEINQNPAFTKEAPQKQKSLDDLLKFAKPPAAAKK